MNAPARSPLAPTRAPGLAADRDGAVLLIGIFIALALTASLWFMIGIGDAIAFRETAQEATDAGAFSSAVVHARGMNFIAAINLIMFGVTVVYLILAIIADLFAVALATCVGPAFKPCSYDTDGAIPAALETAQNTFQESSEDFRDGVVKTTIKAGHQLQKLVAIASPWAGSFAANRVAGRYDDDLVASTVGLSQEPNIEGSGMVAGSQRSVRIGLPVKALHASTLCDRAFASFGIGRWTEKKSGQNFDFGLPPLKAAVSKAAASAVTSLHCSGDFWEEDGPKAVIEEAQNGSDYMQVFGFMMGARMKDTNQSERAVGILSTMKHDYVASPPKANVYLAQAEFFFDCTSTWDSSVCNADDGALYAPRWKVRLRRMRPPVAGMELGNAAASLLTAGAAAIGSQVVGIPDVDQTLQRMTDAASAQVAPMLAEQMKSFFTAPPIPLQIPTPAIGGAIGKLPMPGYTH
jgi:hypothetical protein